MSDPGRRRELDGRIVQWAWKKSFLRDGEFAGLEGVLMWWSGDWCKGKFGVRASREKSQLDYLVSHQILEGGEGSLDVEIFHLPQEGTFAVFALSDLQGLVSKRSIVYKWTRGRFKFYQWLPTLSAQSIEYFAINYQYFIAIANYGASSFNPTNSTIFKWNKSLRLFQPHQNIVTYTARDVEAFQIEGNYYLAIANHAQG
ncbi:hypothetical protein Btru_030847 [Bulinus truncatus]|nr:hypothetical protein Btru_030847 [Bulinus truncatus]